MKFITLLARNRMKNIFNFAILSASIGLSLTIVDSSWAASVSTLTDLTDLTDLNVAATDAQSAAAVDACSSPESRRDYPVHVAVNLPCRNRRGRDDDVRRDAKRYCEQSQKRICEGLGCSGFICKKEHARSEYSVLTEDTGGFRIGPVPATGTSSSNIRYAVDNARNAVSRQLICPEGFIKRGEQIWETGNGQYLLPPFEYWATATGTAWCYLTESQCSLIVDVKYVGTCKPIKGNPATH